MSLSRVSSIDGLQMGREGTRASISHRRMSFNPVSDWVPELQKGPSVPPTYTREEVSKGKRIGELAARDITSILPPQTLTRCSSGNHRRYILPLCCWSCLWLRRYQTGPRPGRSL